ncbi:MAG: hypothetical protein ACKPAF_02045, partial [Actinomycetota bacterium]
ERKGEKGGEEEGEKKGKREEKRREKKEERGERERKTTAKGRTLGSELDPFAGYARHSYISTKIFPQSLAAQPKLR